MRVYLVFILPLARSYRESTLTEAQIYLRPFEIAIQESRPRAIMTAYNRENGTYVSEHKRLLGTILREEWGYDGLVMSDWWGT